jgi:hypothetical protein
MWRPRWLSVDRRLKERLTLRTPTQADADYLAKHLRQADVDELAVTGYPSAAQAVQWAYERTLPELQTVVEWDGEMLIMTGCAADTLLSNVGVPWLLGTEAMMKHMKAITIGAHQAIAIFLTHWPILRNVVDARNTATIRWVQSLGFDLTPVPEWVPGFPVYQFEKRRNEYVREV